MVEERNRFREVELAFETEAPGDGYVYVSVRVDRRTAEELERAALQGAPVGMSLMRYGMVERVTHPLWLRVLGRVLAWGRRILRALGLARVRV